MPSSRSPRDARNSTFGAVDRGAGALEHRRRHVEPRARGRTAPPARRSSVPARSRPRRRPRRADRRRAGRTATSSSCLPRWPGRRRTTSVGAEASASHVDRIPRVVTAGERSPPPAGAAKMTAVREVVLRPRGPYSLALTARLAGDATRPVSRRRSSRRSASTRRDRGRRGAPATRRHARRVGRERGGGRADAVGARASTTTTPSSCAASAATRCSAATTRAARAAAAPRPDGRAGPAARALRPADHVEAGAGARAAGSSVPLARVPGSASARLRRRRSSRALGAGGSASSRPARASRRRPRPALPLARPRAAARRLDGGGGRRGSSASAASGPGRPGVVCLEGLGRRERGLVGDLGLIKLAVGPPRPLGGRSRDGGAARAVRRVGGPRERLPAQGLGAWPRPAGRVAAARSGLSAKRTGGGGLGGRVSGLSAKRTRGGGLGEPGGSPSERQGSAQDAGG